MITKKHYTNNKNYKTHYVPDKYAYLTKKETIEYKNITLKTAYLINIIHELLIKYYFHKNDLIENEVKINLSSLLLKKKYGMHYNYYIDYLVEHDFMFLLSNYFVNGKARTYKLHVNSLINIKKYKVTDKVILKKYTREYLHKTYLENNNSPIPLDLRKILVNCLYKIELDVNKALEYITVQKEDKILSHNKYWKNKISIENIGEIEIFFKFDRYGRLHTNFTVLKKEVRQKFITINGEDACETDLFNSQPFFLAQLLKQQMTVNQLTKMDVIKYIELVKNGVIYEEIMTKCGIEKRDDAKKMMYKVMFGQNGEHSGENVLFYKLFPTVYKFITNYKSKHGSYKELSHKLQNLESTFIFGQVIPHILQKEPDFTFFTVHDSLCYPLRHRKIVNDIFDYYKRQIL